MSDTRVFFKIVNDLSESRDRNKTKSKSRPCKSSLKIDRPHKRFCRACEI